MTEGSVTFVKSPTSYRGVRAAWRVAFLAGLPGAPLLFAVLLGNEPKPLPTGIPIYVLVDDSHPQSRFLVRGVRVALDRMAKSPPRVVYLRVNHGGQSLKPTQQEAVLAGSILDVLKAGLASTRSDPMVIVGPQTTTQADAILTALKQLSKDQRSRILFLATSASANLSTDDNFVFLLGTNEQEVEAIVDHIKAQSDAGGGNGNGPPAELLVDAVGGTMNGTFLEELVAAAERRGLKKQSNTEQNGSALPPEVVGASTIFLVADVVHAAHLKTLRPTLKSLKRVYLPDSWQPLMTRDSNARGGPEACIPIPGGTKSPLANYETALATEAANLGLRLLGHDVTTAPGADSCGREEYTITRSGLETVALPACAKPWQIKCVSLESLRGEL